jgi:transcriptional regulator with XRE-family HTH domain
MSLKYIRTAILPSMTDSGSTTKGGAMDVEKSFALELRARRLLLGLSIKKLSNLSGLSRRWVTCAERGSNITIDVLTRLMQTMNISVITICPGLTAEAGLAARGTAELAEAVDEITRSTALAQHAAERIKSLAMGVGKSVSKDTPQDEGVNERASSLLTRFTEHVRSLSDPDKLQKIEEAVSSVLRPEAEAQGTAKSRPGRRRKSSG